MPKSSVEIRRDFIQFFSQRGHTFVPGSSVVPYDDPTLLFTNAGMNQFKDVFLGTGTRPYRRAVNSQPCIRAGGKHNDLDDVGHDTYHHTCFEMLGNWSFGDYFKAESIAWAWELLTKVWGVDPSRLHATYFGGDPAEGLEPDIEARDLWRAVPGMAPERVHPGSKKDNFWEMGESGPCGPCSEVHIDLTPDKSGAKLVNSGDHRVMEIWNLVFIQYNRGPDGKLTPLPDKHVDTGMGFERISGVLQGHSNNYATDVFWPIIQAVESRSGHHYGTRLPRPAGANRYAVFDAQSMQDTACRVIADHIRTLTFAIADGATPDKEGRGYVLRRILRRAVRYGWQYLDLKQSFVSALVPTVVDVLGEAFPKLRENPARVAAILHDEEASFGRTLERGIALFEEAAERAMHEHHGELRGEDAFRLHDTFGFPVDLTEIMAGERKLRVDIGEYERLMDAAREKARGRKSGSDDFLTQIAAGVLDVKPALATDDSPKYLEDTLDRSTLTHILRPVQGGELGAVCEHPQTAGPGEKLGLIFDRTCFYAEQGGQIGDRGRLTGGGVRVDVETALRFADAVVLVGTLVQGTLQIGQSVEQHVHSDRGSTRKNHSATHVLNWALRETLGEHVQQRGSLVDPEKTRFDFSHPGPLSSAELDRIELLVREQISANLPIYAQSSTQAEALKINGLRAVFGEKYPEIVRVVSIGAPVDRLLANPGDAQWRKYSIEFCGGTHARSTGEIGAFAITGDEAVAKGIRRLVGITGDAAVLAEEVAEALIATAGQLAKYRGSDFAARVAALQTSVNDSVLPIRSRTALRDELAKLQGRMKSEQKERAGQSAGDALARVPGLIAAGTKRSDTLVVVADMGDLAVDALKTVADAIKQKCGSAAVLFGATEFAADASDRGKVTLLAAVTDDLVKKSIKAGDWVKAIAPMVEGGGGGPPTMAQAGGKNAARLAQALAAGEVWCAARL